MLPRPLEVGVLLRGLRNQTRYPLWFAVFVDGDEYDVGGVSMPAVTYCRVLGVYLNRDVHGRIADPIHRPYAGHQRPQRDPLAEVHPIDARRHRRGARMSDRRDGRRL